MVRHQHPGAPARPRPEDDRAATGFMGSVNVLTESGWLEISRIVRHRLPVRVACADLATGRVDYRPVVDWACRCLPEGGRLILETAARAGNRRSARGAHRALRIARDHPMPTPGGPRRAAALAPGDAIYTLGTYLEPWQEQLVLGSFLGDGYAGGHGPGRYSGLAICHGFDQRAYLDWKFAKLANVGAKRPSTQKLTLGGFAKRPTSRFTTRLHPRLDALADEFYRGGVKRPPPGVVARAGWLGLRIWFADDGGCIFNNASGRITTFRIHTNAFAVEEVDGLVGELREFTGLPWRRYMQNGRYPIVTMGNGDGISGKHGQGNLDKWVGMIRPYLPPMLGYKLRGEACGETWEGLAPPGGEWLEPTTVKAIGPYQPAHYEDCLIYNLTVAGHGNFVVHGVLVGDAAAGAGL